MLLKEWLNTEEGQFWEEKAHQSADDGDGYFDDIIDNLFWQHCEGAKSEPAPTYKKPEVSKIPTTCKGIRRMVEIYNKYQVDNNISKFFEDIEFILEDPEFNMDYTLGDIDSYVEAGHLTYREVLIHVFAIQIFEQS